jgi:hypothetical protein
MQKSRAFAVIFFAALVTMGSNGNSAGCTPEEGEQPEPSITIRVPKNSERPKNKDKRYSNKPQIRTSPCSPGDKRWICPRRK